MLCHKLEFCAFDQAVSVIRFNQIMKMDSGLKIFFSYPQILLWSVDFFGYVNALQVNDVMTADTEKEAKALIERRVSEIYRWEHRKAYDGITAVIPPPDE